MPSTPASRRGRVPEASARPRRYGSFRDEHDCAGLMVAAVNAGETQVERVSIGTKHGRHRLSNRPELGVPVALLLDRFGVDTERHIVHEDAAVDLGEIHHTLAPLRKRVQSADDVIAVDTEIESEMVTRAGRHAHIRKSAFGGDRGDDRLRPIPARHAHGVGAVGDCVAHQRREVVAEMQLDRLHPASASLARDLKALCLPAARFRVIEQHGPLRRSRNRQLRVDGEHPPRGCQREHERREDQRILEHAALEHD